MQKVKKEREGEKVRKVYSFKLEECRKYEDSDKNFARSNKIMGRVENVDAGQRCRSPAENARFYSSELRLQKRVGMPLKG